MELAGLILIAVGASDLVRQYTRRMRGVGIVVTALIYAIVIVVGMGLGLSGVALLPPVLALVWLWTMPVARARMRGFAPVVLLAVVCIASVAVAPAPTGWLQDAWDGMPSLARWPLTTVVLVLGLLLFLLESSNVVVRTALTSERAPAGEPDDEAGESSDEGAPVSRRGWGRVFGRARPVSTEPEEAAGAQVMRGGRLIGPLERLLIVVLSLAGAYHLVAALVAAKGIVRFPEISRDRGNGTQAEYFLVGSMVSWTLALASAGLLWLAVGSAGG